MAATEFRFPDRAACAAAIAGRLADALRDAIRRDGSASLVVPGGKTPIPVFAALAETDLGTGELGWENVNVIPCDERWVAIDHPDSNEGLLRKHLLTGAASSARVFALYRPVPTPQDALADVSRALRTIRRPFDAVFLGMGEDGHFASLFPGRPETAPALRAEGSADLMALQEPAKGHPRIGLTLAALTDARCIVLAVPGPEKQAVLAQATSSGDAEKLPVAALLHQTRAPVEIMICP